MRRIAGLCCLLLALRFIAVAEPQHGKRPITEKDLFAFNWVANAQISPEGSRVAFVRVTVNEKRTGYDTSIWVVPVDGSAEPTRLTAGPHDESPRWSPDGKQMAFLRSVEKEGKPEPPQLYILQMTGGEPWAITSLPKGAKSPIWSPNGKTILLNSRTNTKDIRLAEKKKKAETSAQEHESDVRIITRAIYRLDNVGYLDDKHPSHIWSVAVPSSPDQKVEPKQLTAGIFDEENACWSPDGSRIYFSSVRVSEPYYEPEVLTIYWISTDGGEIHKVMSMDAWSAFAGMAISPDGRQIAFDAAPSKPVFSYSENHPYVVSADGGTPRLIVTNFDHEVGRTGCGNIIGDMEPPRGEEGYRPIWAPDGSALYDTVSIGGTTNVMRFEIATGKVTAFTTGNHNIFEIAADPRASRIVAILSTPDSLLDIYNISNPAQPVQLTHFNDQLFAQLNLSEPEDIKYTSFDGKEIEAWVYKPPDFDRNRKYPLILNIHGGPECAYGYTFFHEFQWMAANGYVVLAPNPRGSSNYGLEFGRLIQYAYPGDDYKDLMAGVDELLRRGYIDEKRLGVTGGSGGGILTNWTITHTNRFAAAVSQRDVADMATFWYTADFMPFTPLWFRGAPWQDPQDFAARSPITHVASVKTPLMLIVGDDDFRAPPAAGGEQMFRALKFLRVPTVMIRFPGESHELSRSGQPWHRVERLQNIVNWFDKYLQGKPMPQYNVPSEEPVEQQQTQEQDYVARMKALGLPSLRGKVLAYYSPGYQQRAEKLQAAIEDMNAFFQGRLEVQTNVVLALLDSKGWTDVTGNPYGLPMVSVTPPVIFMPATSGSPAFALMIARKEAIPPETLQLFLKNNHTTFEAVAEQFVDLIGFHELGHALTYNFGIDPASLWLDEFLASYWSYAYISERQPEWKRVFDLLGRPSKVRPKNTSLEEFERLYMRVDDYGWYQGMFEARIREIYPELGLKFLSDLLKNLPRSGGSASSGAPSRTMEPTQVLKRLEKIAPGFQEWALGFSRAQQPAALRRE